MKSYFAYIRVSTTKQSEHGSSLQEQRSAIIAYAARHDLPITAWFEETDTAAKQGRREFVRLTNLLRAGKATGVIIHKIDRSARNLKDWAGLGELIDAGVEVLFAHESLDMTTRGGRLAADIQAVVAADFIRNLRDEVRKGFYGRLKQGFYPLPAPRGYLDRGGGREKAVCPIEGPLVRQAFELYGSGTYSLELLRHELASRGLRSGTGNPLSYEALSLILRNPFYIGLMRIRTTGELFDGNHAPLVSTKLFDRVQAIMDGRLYPRTEKHVFLFRRLVRCARCGRSLTGERQKGHIYYRCHDRGCRGVSAAETKIDERVTEALQALSLKPGDVRDLRDLFQQQLALEDIVKDERHGHLERDLALIDQRLSRLTDAVIDGVIDKPSYEARKASLLHQRRELTDRLRGGGEVTFWQNVAQRFERGLTAYLGYQTGNDDEKREMVELVSSNLSVSGKEPVFSMHFPYQEMREWAISGDGAPYQGAVRTLAAQARKPKQRRSPRTLFKRIARQQSVIGFQVNRGRNKSLKSLSPSERRTLAEKAGGIRTVAHETKTHAPAWRPDPRPLLPKPKPRRPGGSARAA